MQRDGVWGWDHFTWLPLCTALPLVFFPSSSMSSPAKGAIAGRLHGCPTGCSFLQDTPPCCGMLWCSEHLLPSPFPDLAGCRVVFYTPFSHCSMHVLPSVKYTYPEGPPSWLPDSAEHCGAAIGASWNQPCQAQGSPSLVSRRGLAGPDAM